MDYSDGNSKVKYAGRVREIEIVGDNRAMRLVPVRDRNEI